MEMDHISLDGVNCEEQGIILLDADLSNVEIKQQETVLPDKLKAIEAEYTEIDPADIPLTMAVVGDGETDLTVKYMAARRWLLSGSRLEMSATPGYYYTGRVTRIQRQEANGKWVKFQVVFRANPYCHQRVMTAVSGFILAEGTRIPEQITAENATVSGTFTSAGMMTLVDYLGAHPAALYLSITGTWTTLAIGGAKGVTINWAAGTAKTVYMDCDLEEVYYLDAGLPVDLRGMATGNMPVMDGPLALPVGGTGIDITVRMLVIERG